MAKGPTPANMSTTTSPGRKREQRRRCSCSRREFPVHSAVVELEQGAVLAHHGLQDGVGVVVCIGVVAVRGGVAGSCSCAPVARFSPRL